MSNRKSESKENEDETFTELLRPVEEFYENNSPITRKQSRRIIKPRPLERGTVPHAVGPVILGQRDGSMAKNYANRLAIRFNPPEDPEPAKPQAQLPEDPGPAKPQAVRPAVFRFINRAKATPYADSKHPGTSPESPRLLKANVAPNFNSVSSKITSRHFAKPGTFRENFDDSQNVKPCLASETACTYFSNNESSPINFNTQTASMQQPPSKRCDLNNDNDCTGYEEFSYWDEEENRMVSYRIPKTEQTCQKLQTDEKERNQSELSCQRSRERGVNAIKTSVNNFNKFKHSWNKEETKISVAIGPTPLITAAKYDLGKSLDKDTMGCELKRFETKIDLASLADTLEEHNNNRTSVELVSSTPSNVPTAEKPEQNKPFLRLKLTPEDYSDSKKTSGDKPSSPGSCWRSECEGKNRHRKKKTRRGKRKPFLFRSSTFINVGDLPMVRWPPPPLSSGSSDGSAEESSFNGGCEFEMYVRTCGDCACSVEDRIAYQ